MKDGEEWTPGKNADPSGHPEADLKKAVEEYRKNMRIALRHQAEAFYALSYILDIILADTGE